MEHSSSSSPSSSPEGMVIKRHHINRMLQICQPTRLDILANSLDCEGDEYDTLGRNISAQQRRQALYPWFTVEN